MGSGEVTAAGPDLPSLLTFLPCRERAMARDGTGTSPLNLKGSRRHRKPQEPSRAEQQPGDPQLGGSRRAMPKPTVPPAAIAHPSPSPPGTAPAASGATAGFEPAPGGAFLPSSFSQLPRKGPWRELHARQPRAVGGTGSPTRGAPSHCSRHPRVQ